MPRSVNAVASRKKRKKLLSQTRGNFGPAGNVWTVAKNTYEKGLGYAYRDRRTKKRHFRTLWIARINAACRENGVSYSVFMGKINGGGYQLNRKVLADLAMNEPQAFAAIAKEVMAAK
jgi:large subunit ribosomal protein L20